MAFTESQCPCPHLTVDIHPTAAAADDDENADDDDHVQVVAAKMEAAGAAAAAAGASIVAVTLGRDLASVCEPMFQVTERRYASYSTD